MRVAVILAGAIGSFGLEWYVGRNNSSLVLMALFAVWVMGPYVGLAVTRAPMGLVWAVAAVSLVVYGYVAVGGHVAKPAAAFLVVPLVSWVAIGLVRWRAAARV